MNDRQRQRTLRLRASTWMRLAAMGVSLARIARDWGVSRQRVHQVISAMRKDK